jgi:hypothetical protein
VEKASQNGSSLGQTEISKTTFFVPFCLPPIFYLHPLANAAKTFWPYFKTLADYKMDQGKSTYTFSAERLPLSAFRSPCLLALGGSRNLHGNLHTFGGKQLRWFTRTSIKFLFYAFFKLSCNWVFQ